MYLIIKKNGENILLCSGTMKDSDFAMVKSEFGIEINQIRFVSQTVIQEYGEKSMQQIKAENMHTDSKKHDIPTDANNVLAAGISDDQIRQNLKKAEHWIEQARLSYFGHKDKAHFKKSLKFASKFINACR